MFISLESECILGAIRHRKGMRSGSDSTMLSTRQDAHVFRMTLLGTRTCCLPHAKDLSYWKWFNRILFFRSTTNTDNRSVPVHRYDVQDFRQLQPFLFSFNLSRDPNRPESLQQLMDGLVWPEYRADEEKYLEMSPAMSVKSRLRARAVQFWNELLPELQRLSKSAEQN